MDVAARVVHSGSGVRLEAESPPDAIAAAVRQVLDDAAYRGAAARIAEVIREETSRDLAVAEIEAVAHQRQAVHAPA